MKASNGIQFRDRFLIALALSTCVSLAAFQPATPAIARTRPPIEMGDPDDTGNQGPAPGPGARAKATSAPPNLAIGRTTSQVAKLPALVAAVLGYLAIWRGTNRWIG